MSEERDRESREGGPDEEIAPIVPVFPFDKDSIDRLLIPWKREIGRISESFALSTREIERMGRAFRAVDVITPQMLKPMELGLSAKLADLLASDSLLAASRNAMLAHTRMAELVARPEWFDSMRVLAESVQGIGAQLVAMSSLTANLASIEGLQLSVRVERAFSISMRSWDGYARRLSSPQTGQELVRLHTAGMGALGIAATVTSIGGGSERARLAEPWETAHQDLREQILERLDAIDGRLVAKLNGAWDRVKNPGPDGISQCATSVIELIDWFLRDVAPDDQVLDWHRDSGRSARELHKGRPTRQLRVRFALRDRHPDGRLANAYVSTLTSIAEELQGIKHAGAGTDMIPVARLLPSVEAVVGFIVL